MNYRQTVPYQGRYLIALAAWAFLAALDALLRFVIVSILPFVWLWTTTGQFSRRGAIILNCLVWRRWMPVPRAQWRKLLAFRGDGAGTGQTKLF